MAGELKEDAVLFAQRAVRCDQEGLIDTAVFFYQASHIFLFPYFTRLDICDVACASKLCECGRSSFDVKTINRD